MAEQKMLSGSYCRLALMSGVEIVHDGKVQRIAAGVEVVLSLGAIHTPKVLMLSFSWICFGTPLRGSATTSSIVKFPSVSLTEVRIVKRWGTKTNPLSPEPLSTGYVCSLSNTGRTTTGRHHEENSFSDGRYSRIHCTFIRAGQNCRSGAAIRCFLVLPGSGYRDDEMSSCQCPACRWWQHEGYRCGSSNTGIGTNSSDG